MASVKCARARDVYRTCDTSREQSSRADVLQTVHARKCAQDVAKGYGTFLGATSV